MQTISNLPTPALLLDLDKLETNIEAMAEKCGRLGVRLRPHVKTHKCPEVGMLQVQSGCQGITVATLYEAKVFAERGFDDITWAFPIPLSRVAEAEELAEKITLRLVIDSYQAYDALAQSKRPFHVFLKVDCGYHRAGVDPQSDDAVALALRLSESPTLEFDGILAHAGHSYSVSEPEMLAVVAEDERSVMAAFAGRLRHVGIEVPTVSVGSTPGMSAVRRLTGVNEARPGNYVFYDGTQVDLGSCAVSDCAVTVLTSVVSSGASSGVAHSIIDAGALAMSKDSGHSSGEQTSYGSVFRDYETSELEPDQRLFALSQEHGWLTGHHAVGARKRILPQHSCLTVAQFDEYHVVRGDEVVDRWKILRGRD